MWRKRLIFPPMPEHVALLLDGFQTLAVRTCEHTWFQVFYNQMQRAVDKFVQNIAQLISSGKAIWVECTAG